MIFPQDISIQTNFQISSEDGRVIMIVREGSIEFPGARNIEIHKSELKRINVNNVFERSGDVITFVIHASDTEEIK